MTRRTRRAAFAVATALLLAGCGSGSEQAAEQAAPPPAPAPAQEAAITEIAAADTSAEAAGHEATHGSESTAASEHAGHAQALPDVQVVRMSNGEKVPLGSLHTAGKSTLLWFWAPHCTFCKAEAPKLVDFKNKHGEKIAVLGLGAQDDLDQAKGFVNETSTTGLEMVWDASGKSWVHYKVTNQPTAIVIDSGGKVVKTWFRDFDEREILAAAGEA